MSSSPGPLGFFDTQDGQYLMKASIALRSVARGLGILFT